MCAICGYYAPETHDSQTIVNMLSQALHRGPDSIGVYLDGDIHVGVDLDALGRALPSRGRISMGHARLEIVGGSAGSQPLPGCHAGWAIIVNGEIYNHHELRQFISGHPQRTESDCELMIHLIEHYYNGDLTEAVRRTLPLLDGMYAFAVTDGHTLCIARDPVGKKPVYFTQADVFAFASERKALRKFGTPIRRLVPGCILTIDGTQCKALYTPRFEQPPIDIVEMDDALARYRHAFDLSIRKRVRGLDRVGVLFSGGIDSLLVGVAARAAGADVTAYCVGLKGSGDVQAARQAAESLGLKVRILELTDDQIESSLPEVIERIELNGIIQVEAAIPMYAAARMCSEDGHKVILSGQAADELFAGYSWYGDVVRDQGYAVLHDRLWDDIEKLYLDTLEREDRMTMAHSVELRAPFLDRELIRTAMRMVPQGIKIEGPSDRYRKHVHRRLALEFGIPRELAYREKSRAQDGTGIHNALKRIASARGVSENGSAPLLDYGSNYRYIDDEYTDNAVHAFIADLTQRNGIEILGTAQEEDYDMEVQS
jgi:asparagine synthase (glutamine-hydrolysing)